MKIKCLFLACSLLILTLVPAPTPVRAYAEQVEYKRVVNEKTPFFIDEKGVSCLFYLPKGYYVKVLSTNDNFLHVECFGSGGTPSIDGYVEKNSVIDCLSQVTSPYLSMQVKTSCSCVLYEDTSLNQTLHLLFKDKTLFYYGEAVSDNGQNLICVYYNGKIGYVKETDVYPFSVPNHPEPINAQNSTPSQARTEITTDTSLGQFNGLKTAVIVCLFLAGIIALCIALRKKGDSSCATLLDDDNVD